MKTGIKLVLDFSAPAPVAGSLEFYTKIKKTHRK
jgi:hypothetical protein